MKFTIRSGEFVTAGKNSQLVDRTMMELVFPPDKLVRLAEGRLPAGLHEVALSFLTGIGLPDVRSSWFTVDVGFFEEESPGGIRLCGDLRHFPELENMPDGAEKWIILGGIHFDAIVLDPVSGIVYSLPDGEYGAAVLSQNLDSFGYFLYLLESERPHYDYTVSEEITDSEGIAEHLREVMVRTDPLPFENVEPAWSENFDWEADDAPRLPTWDLVLSDVYEAVG